MPDFARIIRPALERSAIPEDNHEAVLATLRNRAERNVRASSGDPARAEAAAVASIGEVISEIARHLTHTQAAEGAMAFEDEVTAERVELILGGLCAKFRLPYPWCPARD